MAGRTLQLFGEAEAVLQQLSDATHASPHDVMRDALSVYWWIARELSNGSTLFVSRRDTPNTATDIVLNSLEGMSPIPPGAVAPTNAPTDGHETGLRPSGDAGAWV